MAAVTAVSEHALYLIACALHEQAPAADILAGMDIPAVLRFAGRHSLSALCCHALQKTALPQRDEWAREILGNIRRNALFQAEQQRFCDFCEENGIRNAPLKGSILQFMYPTGTREMADRDILFDGVHAAQVRSYFEQNGYETKYFDIGKDDIYIKQPMYHFELHRSLFADYPETPSDVYFRGIRRGALVYRAQLVEKKQCCIPEVRRDHGVRRKYHGRDHREAILIR